MSEKPHSNLLELLTPSDHIVLKPGFYVPILKRKKFFRKGRMVHIDGTRRDIESKPYANLLLKVALLANHQKKYGVLTIEDGNMYINPSNQMVELPKESLEWRLLPFKQMPLKEWLKQWLASPSIDIWLRVAQTARNIQVIRGNLAFVPRRIIMFQREYYWTDTGLEYLSAEPFELDSFFDSITDFEKLSPILDHTISSALKDMLSKDSKNDISDPWALESAENRKRYATYVQTPKEKKVVTGIVIALLSVPAYHCVKAIYDELIIQQIVLMAWLVITVVFLYLLSPFARTRIAIWNLKQIGNTAFGKPYENIPEHYNIFRNALGIYIVAIIGFGLVVGGITAVLLNQLFWGIILSLFAAGYLWSLLQRTATSAISYAVKTNLNHIDSKNEAADIVYEKASALSPILNKEVQDEVSDDFVQLHVIESDKIPPVTEVIQEHYENGLNRFPRLIGVYNRKILLSIGACALFVSLSALLLDRFTATLGMLLFIIGLTLFRYIKRYGFKYFGKIISQKMGKFQRKEYEQHVNDLLTKKPNFSPLISSFWSFLSYAYAAAIYLSSQFEHGWLSILLIGVTLLIRYDFKKNKRFLEKDVPVTQAPKLLLLRIFTGKGFGEFNDIIGTWKHFGVTQFLDGPDSLKGEVSDLLNAFTGNIEDSIIEDEEELNKRIASFKREPNNDLIFPTLHMQCANKSWKAALHYFVNDSDIIAVDLSGISAENQGISFEVEKLLNEVPLQKVLFVVNDQTDLEAVKKPFLHAASRLEDSSPNIRKEGFYIQLIRHTGTTVKRASESHYEWIQRVNQKKIDRELVCLLLEKAKRSMGDESFFNDLHIPWTRWSWRDVKIRLNIRRIKSPA